MSLLAEHDLIIRRSLVTWTDARSSAERPDHGLVRGSRDASDARWPSRTTSGPGSPAERRVSFESDRIAAGRPVDHDDDLSVGPSTSKPDLDAADPSGVLTSISFTRSGRRGVRLR